MPHELCHVAIARDIPNLDDAANAPSREAPVRADREHRGTRHLFAETLSELRLKIGRGALHVAGRRDFTARAKIPTLPPIHGEHDEGVSIRTERERLCGVAEPRLVLV